MENKVLFWDFDGTLVYCHHLWSSSMWRAITDEPAGEDITLEEVRPYMQMGYPWDLPHLDSSALSTPELWWAFMEKHFYKTSRSLGLPEDASLRVSHSVRRYILTPHFYHLYPDTISVLEECRRLGWKNHLLSNNYPELPAMIEKLGLSFYLDGMTISALAGKEKPSPELFATARKEAGFPQTAVMIGDNPKADIKGGQAAGMKTIQVHPKSPSGADAVCHSLSEIPPVLQKLFSP